MAATTPSNKEAADENHPIRDRGGGGDILVVDDSPANLLALRTALSGMGGEVVQAQSGDEALHILLEREFALILLDVNMPSLNGFETARLIRQRKRSRHTPIIFITAYSRDDRDVMAAYRLGAVDFLFKPFGADVLRAKASVFVELQLRTAEVARQAHLLREHERREHEHEIAEARRRWNEEAMRRRMEELAEADRRKDEFLAILGHELRNPLAPIVAGLDLMRVKLAGQPGVDEVVHQTRERIEQQVRQLRRLVDDLLDVSRINSGKIELRPAPVTVQEVLEHAVSTSRPVIDARRHQLTVALPAEPVMLLADAVRLTQVFSNLLNNAAAYTEPGGAIRLACSVDGAWVNVSVADNGRGIGPDLLPRIFDLFAQGNPGGGGLGLGLTVVKRLVEMHAGTVSVRSGGEVPGSEFVVRLPVVEKTAAAADDTGAGAARPPPSITRAPARPLRIVVVDDNEDIRETMCELLTVLGHSVERAADGAKGAELILRLRPDLALVDIGMPGLDGYQVARRVRAELGGARVRLVAMTGYGAEPDRRRALEAGFDAHLTKPVDLEDLTNVLLEKEDR